MSAGFWFLVCVAYLIVLGGVVALFGWLLNRRADRVFQDEIDRLIREETGGRS